MLIYLKLFCTALLWGASFVAARVLGEEAGPYTASFIRFFLSSAFLVFFCFWRTGGLPRLSWRDFQAVAMLAFVGFFLYSVFLFMGLETVSAGRTAVIFAASPVFIAACAALLFQEEFGLATCLGTILSMSGAILVITQGQLTALMEQVTAGDFYIILSMLSSVAYSVLSRYLVSRMSPLAITTWSCFAVTLFLFIPAYNEGLFGTIASLSVSAWIIFLYLSTLATILGTFWYVHGVQALGAGRTGVFMNFVPVSAVLLGYALLDEPIDISLAIGCVLVLAGTSLVNRKRPTQ